MDNAAPQPFSVRAASVAAEAVVISARCLCAIYLSRYGVDGPEAGGGEGDEDLWSVRHGGGHVVVATGGTGMDQLPGVAGIQVRAGRADVGAAIVAPRPHHPRPPVLIGTDQLDGVGAESDRFGSPPP